MCDCMRDRDRDRETDREEREESLIMYIVCFLLAWIS